MLDSDHEPLWVGTSRKNILDYNYIVSDMLRSCSLFYIYFQRGMCSQWRLRMGRTCSSGFMLGFLFQCSGPILWGIFRVEVDLPHARPSSASGLSLSSPLK